MMSLKNSEKTTVTFLVAGLLTVTLVLLLFSGLGTRWEWWDFRQGLTFLKWGVWTALASFVVGIAGFFVARSRQWGAVTLALCALTTVVGVTVFINGLRGKAKAETLPRIHDITTDLENPPEFDAILPLRHGSMNSAEYGGSEVAQQQKKAYPEIQPLVMPIVPDQAFEEAMTAAQALHWQIVASEKPVRIEATDTTFWFGFKDDVVIRLQPTLGGTRVDVRSVSRVGISDVGTNAERISQFLNLMRKSAD
jgi:uncharacterized protein (DUF1499 family)